MELDLRTLYFTLTAVAMVLAIVLLLIWKTQNSLTGIRPFTVAILFAVVGALLVSFRGAVPVAVSILGGNLCFTATLLLVLRSFRALRGKPGLPILEIAVPVLMTLGLAYFTFVDFDTAARIMVVESLFAAVSLFGAFDLFREKRPELKSGCNFVAVVFVIFSVSMAAIVAATFFVGADPVYLQTRTTVAASTVLVTLGALIGWTLGFLWIAYELSQARLRQVEKLDAVGRLAGGIAHELNNILTPISGLTSALLHKMGPDDGNRRPLEMVLHASSRAAELVRGILTFGQRQHAMMPKKIDISAVVRDSVDALRADLPDSLTVTATIEDATGSVVADAEYIRLVLGNLVSNAIDAMKATPGRLEVSLAAVQITAKLDAEALGLAPGAFARLTVADNGTGMNETTLKQAIDPFFTTKDVGMGVGLGLSVVNGIAAMAGGALRLSSVPGLGTSAEVYLPLAGD